VSPQLIFKQIQLNNYIPNIKHRHSIRLKGYDYSKEGLYFLTICLQDRKCLFGQVIDGKMNLNNAGKFSDDCWLEIPKHFPNAVLHEHVIMPNHVHGIIELIKSGCPNESLSSVGVENFQPLRSPNESLSSVGVQNFEPQRNEYQKIIPHSIGSIVRGFKTGFTKWYRNNSVGVQNFEPLQSPNESLLLIGFRNFGPQQPIWQRNYYEHIIRNEHAYQRIADYIINNPENWKKDKFFDCE
jgi:putative transposase